VKIGGLVSRSGRPVEGAYVDLLDASGTFIAESRTGPDGRYSFHTSPGKWTLVCRAAGAEAARRDVDAEPGEAELAFDL
jgi:hypothetical protein